VGEPGEGGARLVELALGLERVPDRLLRQRAQRMPAGGLIEERLQGHLCALRVALLQLEEADLRLGGLRRRGAREIRSNLLQGRQRRLLPLLPARERLDARLRLRFGGQRARRQLQRGGQLGPGLRLA